MYFCTTHTSGMISGSAVVGTLLGIMWALAPTPTDPATGPPAPATPKVDDDPAAGLPLEEGLYTVSLACFQSLSSFSLRKAAARA